jgi:hypothetical protein
MRMGSADDLPKFETQFDKILAVNNMGMWRDPDAVLARLRSMLASGGRIAIVSQPRCPGATAETTRESAQEITGRLGRAGFADLRTETLDLNPPVACVLAGTGRGPS